MKWIKKFSSPGGKINGVFGESQYFKVYLQRNKEKNYFWWTFSIKPEYSKEEGALAEGKIYKDERDFELCQKIVEKFADDYESNDLEFIRLMNGQEK